MSKLFTAFLIAVLALLLATAQSSAAERANKFNWRKCMAQETSTGLSRWSAAARCAKFRRDRRFLSLRGDG
jgi:spermidine/putrescine-binding protein